MCGVWSGVVEGGYEEMRWQRFRFVIHIRHITAGKLLLFLGDVRRRRRRNLIGARHDLSKIHADNQIRMIDGGILESLPCLFVFFSFLTPSCWIYDLRVKKIVGEQDSENTQLHPLCSLPPSLLPSLAPSLFLRHGELF